MKKVFKRIVRILSVLVIGAFVLAAVGFLVFIAVALPSPYHIQQKAFRTRDSAVASARSREEKKAAPAIKPVQALAPASGSVANDAEPSSPNGKELYEALVDERKPLSSACAALDRIEGQQIGKVDAVSFGKRLKASLTAAPRDPLFESIKPILKFTLIQPMMKDLVAQIEEAQRRSALDTFIDKVHFYHEGYGAYQEMTANKERMNRISESELPHDDARPCCRGQSRAWSRLNRDGLLLEHRIEIEQRSRC
jgi:hypothetical protein